MMHGIGIHGGGMGFGWIIGLLVLILIIWLIVKAVNQSATPNQGEHESAIDILKERYAKGEINRGEYEQKRKDLL